MLFKIKDYQSWDWIVFLNDCGYFILLASNSTWGTCENPLFYTTVVTVLATVNPAFFTIIIVVTITETVVTHPRAIRVVVRTSSSYSFIRFYYFIIRIIGSNI